MAEIMNAPVSARWSTHSQILGFFEQQSLFNAINFQLPPEIPNMDSLQHGFHDGIPGPQSREQHCLPDRDRGIHLPLGPGRIQPIQPDGMAAITTTETKARGSAMRASKPQARSPRATYPRARSTTEAASTWPA